MKKNRQKPAAAGFNPSLWVGKKLRKTSHSISYEYVTVTNAFAVKFEGLRSSVVSRRLLRFHFQRRSLSWSKLIQVARGPLGLPRILGCSLLLCRSAMAKRKSGGCRFSKFFVWATFQNLFPVTSNHSSCAKTQTQRQMHSSQWRIRMIWSLSFCAAFFLAVRGDVTFVWESVTNHVIWIVYLININYVTIR